MRYLSIVLFFIISVSQAQQIKPEGRFLKDTIKIGEPLGYALSLRYPREKDVIFPDSLFNFSPYELVDKKYFPTRSNDSLSYDSAIYYLITFEIDTVQTLKLPVFEILRNDSIEHFSTVDTVILQQLVTEIPDSVATEAAPLKENTTYIKVPLQFNYPYFIIGGLILLVAIILVIVFFGKSIRRYFQLRKLQKSNAKFLEQYEQITQPTEQMDKQAEQVLILWKKYLEKLEQLPLTKLTTKEILKKYNPQEIETDLRTIDRAIYASAHNLPLDQNYESLKDFSQARFKQKVEEVKNE